MAKSPFTVGDLVFLQRHALSIPPCETLCTHGRNSQTGTFGKTWLVALEYLPLSVGALVTCLEISDEKKKPMKWCYVFTIPYYH